jgi:hypothetical protein
MSGSIKKNPNEAILRTARQELSKANNQNVEKAIKEAKTAKGADIKAAREKVALAVAATFKGPSSPSPWLAKQTDGYRKAIANQLTPSLIDGPAEPAKPAAQQKTSVLHPDGTFNTGAAAGLANLKVLGGIAGINHATVVDAQGILSGSNAKPNKDQWGNTATTLLAIKHNDPKNYPVALDAIGKLYGASTEQNIDNLVKTAPYVNTAGAWHSTNTAVGKGGVVSGSDISKHFADNFKMPARPADDKTPAAVFNMGKVAGLANNKVLSGVAGINHATVADAQGILSGGIAKPNNDQWANMATTLLASKHNDPKNYSVALDAIGKRYGASTKTKIDNLVKNAPYLNTAGAWHSTNTAVGQGGVVSGSDMSKYFAAKLAKK